MSPISTGGDGGGNAGKASLVFKEKRGKQILKEVPRDVPGGPVAKTPYTQCRGPECINGVCVCLHSSHYSLSLFSFLVTLSGI